MQLFGGYMFRDTLLTGPETHVLRRILVELLGNPSRIFPKFPCSMPRFSIRENELGGFVGEMSHWGSMNLVSWEFLVQETTALRNVMFLFKEKPTFKRKNLHILRKYNFFTNILSCLKGMLHTFGTLQENSSNSTCFLMAIISSMDPIPVFFGYPWLSQMIGASWAETWLAIHQARDEIAWNFIRSEKIPVLPPIFTNSEWSISININTNGQLSMYIHIYSPISTYIHQYSHISTYIHTHRIHVWYIC